MADKSFPSSTLFHYPILQTLADGNIHTSNELIAKEIEILSVSEANQKVLTPGKNGKVGVNKVDSWTRYAIADLKHAEFIARSGEGYVITDSGKLFYEGHKTGFVASELKASEPYCKYKKIGKFKSSSKEKPASEYPFKPTEEHGTKEPSGETPPPPDIPITVKLSDLAESANAMLPESLLDAVKKIKPQSFEVLIKKLLLKMGYGKSTDDVVVTQYSRDGGIDAYVNADALGIKKLCCVQAKRYSDSVDVKTVRELVGSLAEYDCENGIIMTTSSFTKGAKEYNTKRYQILLVDGRKLADYMIKYGLGITTKQIEVKTVDTDFLNNL